MLSLQKNKTYSRGGGRSSAAAATRGRSEDGVVAVVVALAAGAGNKFGRALDALEGEVRVVGVQEPVEAPVAAGLEGIGEAVALAARRDTAVTLAGQTAELGSATIEETNATTGNVQVEVVVAKVTARAGRLDNHDLAGHGARGEGEPEVH